MVCAVVFGAGLCLWSSLHCDLPEQMEFLYPCLYNFGNIQEIFCKKVISLFLNNRGQNIWAEILIIYAEKRYSLHDNGTSFSYCHYSTIQDFWKMQNSVRRKRSMSNSFIHLGTTKKIVLTEISWVNSVPHLNRALCFSFCLRAKVVEEEDPEYA